jgi:hypothetical protein
MQAINCVCLCRVEAPDFQSGALRSFQPARTGSLDKPVPKRSATTSFHLRYNAGNATQEDA